MWTIEQPVWSRMATRHEKYFDCALNENTNQRIAAVKNANTNTKRKDDTQNKTQINPMIARTRNTTHKQKQMRKRNGPKTNSAYIAWGAPIPLTHSLVPCTNWVFNFSDILMQWRSKWLDTRRVIPASAWLRPYDFSWKKTQTQTTKHTNTSTSTNPTPNNEH